MKWIERIKDFLARRLLSFSPTPDAVDIVFVRLDNLELKDLSVTVLDKDGETLTEDDGTTSRASNPEEFSQLIDRQEER